MTTTAGALPSSAVVAAVLVFELHLPHIHSLKEKRAVITPILEGARRRHRVAAAEVDRQDTWQRATLAFATVSGEEHMAKAVLDEVDRFVWSFPEVDVVESRVRWLEDD
jgi:uncharacterized protein YlxP (DUF503 family)